MCIVLCFACFLCGLEEYAVAINFELNPEEYAKYIPKEPEKHEISLKNAQKDPVELKTGEAAVIKLSDSENKELVRWMTDNPAVVSVDSGGRVDGLKKGSANVTALLLSGKQYSCKVRVVDAVKSDDDLYSTCITANSDILRKNLESKSNRNPYLIRVNRKKNCVTVFTYDEKGKYTVPVRAMVSSCGKNGSTITGHFKLYFKKEWNPLYNNVYGYYVSGISGDYLFHSVPYHLPKSDRLEVDEFNKLGADASLGCVRLAAGDSRWIYKNCKQDTDIIIYDDDNPGPLGKPETIKIKDKSCGWDPTDNNKKNPYNDNKPVIIGAKDITVNKGGEFDALKGVKALDTCSNDITKKISVTGNVVTYRSGVYKLTYSVKDALHRTASKDISVTVLP